MFAGVAATFHIVVLLWRIGGFLLGTLIRAAYARRRFRRALRKQGLPPDVAEALVERYRAGMSLRELVRSRSLVRV